MICDPPYTAHVHRFSLSGVRGRREIAVPRAFGFEHLGDEPVRLFELAKVREWMLFCCALESFGDWKRAAGTRWIRAGLWLKTNPTPQFSGDRPGQGAEGVAICHAGKARKSWNGGGRPAVWRAAGARVPRVWKRHPAEKPVALWRQLLEDFTKPGDLVVDPFAGAGSLGLVCREMGRGWIGWERDRCWYREAIQRFGA